MTRRDTLKLFGLLGVRAVLPARPGRAAVPTVKDPAMAAATAAFGCDLFAKLRSKAGNLFFSPLSIETALAMTGTGARGETLAEMNKVLHLPAGGATGVGELLRSLAPSPGDQLRPLHAKYELAVANALWGQQGLPFRQEFLADTQREYGATLHPVDFRQTEQARRTINRWVEEHTKDKIKDLFAAGSLTADARLVLTNAVYFKGAWLAPFDKKMTKDESFHVTPDKTTQAPLMRRRGSYRYYEGDGVQVVDLPYAGNRVAMTVVLPAGELSPVEEKLSAEQLNKWSAQMASRPGEVLLPRFKTSDEFDLGDTLQGMGMKRAFSPDADFSGICAEPLMISKVVHKAYVDTNEEGSEAAAATGVAMVRASMPVNQPPPFTFRADRPFLFVIRDTATHAPLFLGRFAGPVVG